MNESQREALIRAYVRIDTEITEEQLRKIGSRYGEYRWTDHVEAERNPGYTMVTVTVNSESKLESIKQTLAQIEVDVKAAQRITWFQTILDLSERANLDEVIPF